MTVQFESTVQKGIVIQALNEYKVPLGQATEILGHLNAVVLADIVPVGPVKKSNIPKVVTVPLKKTRKK